MNEETRQLALAALRDAHARAQSLLQANQENRARAVQLQQTADQLIEQQLRDLDKLEEAIDELDQARPADDEGSEVADDLQGSTL